MTTESDALREALFAQMSAPPLPEYSGDAVILRAFKMPTPNSVAHHILPPRADAFETDDIGWAQRQIAEAKKKKNR